MRKDRPATENASESPEVLEARRRVVSALECLERSERDALEGLQHALCSYVGALRSIGVPAAKTTDLVTGLVSAPATYDGSLVMIPAVRAALVELAVGWCVAEYGRLERSERERPNAPQPRKDPGAGEASPPA